MTVSVVNVIRRTLLDPSGAKSFPPHVVALCPPSLLFWLAIVTTLVDRTLLRVGLVLTFACHTLILA